MKWVSVKDRLPEDEQKVIFYIMDCNWSFCGYFLKHPYKSSRRFTPSDKDVFFDELSNWWSVHDVDKSYPVTHWMPAPKPPMDS